MLGFQSVWASACQDHIVGGHAGVGVVSLGGAALAAPSLLIPGFREFHRLGRAVRVTLPTGDGGVVHLLVVCGCQGAEEDSQKLLLTDRLLGAVLAEAQVVCVGQPMLLVGDFNADPGVIPCLAKCIASGRLVDLALAYSLGVGKEPDATCRFKLDEGVGTRRDFFVDCPNALAVSTSCGVTDRWKTPHFSVFSELAIRRWAAQVSGPEPIHPFWPACSIDTPDRSSSSATRAVQDAWDVSWEELEVVPNELVHRLRAACDRSSVRLCEGPLPGDELWLPSGMSCRY